MHEFLHRYDWKDDALDTKYNILFHNKFSVAQYITKYTYTGIILKWAAVSLRLSFTQQFYFTDMKSNKLDQYQTKSPEQ